MPITDASTPTAICLALTYDLGTGDQVDRYTSAATAIAITGDGTYASDPSLSVDLGEQSGRGEVEPVEVRMRATQEPWATIATAEPFPAVSVIISEVEIDDPDATQRILARGTLQRTIVNPGGQPGLVRAEIHGPRGALMDRPLGVSATTTCPWRFGDAACGVDTAALTESATVDSISGLSVTLTGLTTTATTGYWRRGIIRRGGLSIAIRAYTTGSTMTLDRPAPSSWDGQAVEVVPGCSKEIGQCRDRWSNEARFGGCGFAIPARDPRYGSV
jgi:hypothetical protein